MPAKVALGAFLARNPFPKPWTDGLFYREKMRAIHRVSPDRVEGPVLDVGGGTSDLLAMLYPEAEVVSIDLDAAPAPGARALQMRGDATRLPFADATFGLVALFDVVEHIPAHADAAVEARRVLADGGELVVSTPHLRWRYPRNPLLRGRVRDESELMAEWGHVRRGYLPGELDELVGATPLRTATFGGLFVSPFHDVSFSGWSPRRRRAAYALLGVPVALGYAAERFVETGNELVRCYQPGRAVPRP